MLVLFKRAFLTCLQMLNTNQIEFSIKNPRTKIENHEFTIVFVTDTYVVVVTGTNVRSAKAAQ